MITLAIEASTYTGSVAVIRDGAVIAEGETAMRGVDEERLMPATADALTAAGVAPNAIDRVACGAGPGSFTSLRIAGSIAKGLALAVRVPLYPVSSLLLIVAGAEPALRPGRYAAVLDAMRGECFACVFSVTDAAIAVESRAMIVARSALGALADAHSARLIGPAQEIDAHPHARGVARLGSLVAWPPAAELATWEPDYGRLAEAQVKWEAAHGRALTTG